MANKVEIEVDVDAKGADRELESTEKAIKGVGDAAEQTDDKLRGVGDGFDKLGSRVRGFQDQTDKGRQASERYGEGLDGVGNRADELDTRMMGTSDAITGVTDLMAGPGVVGPHGMAMGMADLGSAMYNTIIPSMKDAKDGIANFIKSSGGVGGALKSVALAAGAAGLAVAAGMIAWNAYQNTQQEVKKRTEELADAFEQESRGVADAVRNASILKLAHSDVGDSLKDLDADFKLLADGMRETPRAAEELDNAMQAIIEGHITAREVFKGTGIASSAYTDELVRMIDNENLSAGAKKDLINALDGESDRLQDAASEQELLADATEGTTEAANKQAEAIRGVSDALQAQMDPLFGAVDAARSLRDSQESVAEAQQALNTAIAEHGANSPEAVEATRALETANYDAASAAYGFDSAQRELTAAVADGSVSIDSARATLESWVAQGLITEGQADLLASAFNHVKTKAEDAAGTYNVAMVGNDYVSSVVDRINEKMATLKDHDLTIRTHYVSTGQGGSGGIPLGNAHGGIVGAHYPSAATGGVRGAMTWVGEYGPELVRLPHGSTVIPANTSREMASGGGGGGPVGVIEVRGDSNDLVRLLQGWIKANYGGDVQAALGWGRG